MEAPRFGDRRPVSISGDPFVKKKFQERGATWTACFRVDQVLVVSPDATIEDLEEEIRKSYPGLVRKYGFQGFVQNGETGAAEILDLGDNEALMKDVISPVTGIYDHRKDDFLDSADRNDKIEVEVEDNIQVEDDLEQANPHINPFRKEPVALRRRLTAKSKLTRAGFAVGAKRMNYFIVNQQEKCSP